ncbi:efflux transporter outer membrane subunit [Roseovarius aestuariivivens]|uniref:efflux transporter outer membrane subunit n=1 Tax=Roseovarius aestuariivivens TaxID=1888910 RepID=UPI001436CBBD|nr:efflux transporter outer membrane subunit [Roseovarius aestuariivivens]
MRLISICLSAALLAGCSDADLPFRAPEIDLPDRYARMAPVRTPTREDVEWWRSFGDPVLDQLITHGLNGNLSLAQAQARIAEAAAAARRDGVPASGTATGDYRATSGGSNSFDTGLSAQFNLAGETRHRARAARDRLEAARFNEVEARRAVLSEVGQAYVDLRFFQSSRQLRQRDLASRRRTLEDIRTQLAAGEATRLDLLRAQSLLAETRAAIPQVEASIVQTRNRLSTLLGTPVGALSLDLGYKGAQPIPDRVADIGVPADLLRARPDIRRAERLYAAALSDVSAAEAARYPSLRLSGLISAPFGGGGTTESFLAGLVVPVFEQPALAASVDIAESQVQQAYLQWRVAVLQAVEEVENAQILLSSALAARDAAREQVELDRKSLALSRDLVVSGGGITVLDVLDRERALSASRNALAQTTRDVGRAYVALHVALGQGHPLLAQAPVSGNETAMKNTDLDEG